jgi:hypothetical protein
MLAIFIDRIPKASQEYYQYIPYMERRSAARKVEGMQA